MNQIIAIIPARGGSKGLKDKNVRLLCGLPLIAYSIQDALESQRVDQVFVSTDSPTIAAIAQDYGASIIERPPVLASDTATSESALLHALEHLENNGIWPGLVVFLQCTSPLRTGLDIDRAIAQIEQNNVDSLLSVSPSHSFLWHYQHGYPQALNYDPTHRPRRQDLNPQYEENGSIYIFKPWVLKQHHNRLGGKISLFCMEEAQRHQIDSHQDFEYVEFLMGKL